MLTGSLDFGSWTKVQFKRATVVQDLDCNGMETKNATANQYRCRDYSHRHDNRIFSDARNDFNDGAHRQSDTTNSERQALQHMPRRDAAE
jgi:hypothetical protein